MTSAAINVMTVLIRVVLALMLLAVLGFCVFGFLATWEYTEASRRLPWQLGYGAVAGGCVLGALFVWRGPRRS